jgi:hypothetical protein
MRRRRHSYAFLLITAATTGTTFLLWAVPYEWPYNLVALAVCVAAVVGISTLYPPRRVWAAAALVVTVMVGMTTALAEISPRSAKKQIRIYGTVTCANRTAVVGVYIRAFGNPEASGWADWEATSLPFVARYAYVLTSRVKFKAGVGCGGTPHKWRDSLSSKFVTPGRRNFICHDGLRRAQPRRGCFVVD